MRCNSLPSEARKKEKEKEREESNAVLRVDVTSVVPNWEVASLA
jgi:hypothetical protein